MAYQDEKDHQPPHTKLVPGKGTYDEPVEVHFNTNEPATIYYTLDGSKPTYDSETVDLAGTREGAQSLTISDSATIKWFSMDAAGNTEKHYDPEGHGNNYNKAKIVIK